MKHKNIIVNRNIKGFLVPNGESFLIESGTEVSIMQSLGTSFTLNICDNLVRISKKDSDALGLYSLELNKIKSFKKKKLTENICWEVLKLCYDPEIPVNIVDLGLIYNLQLIWITMVEADIKIHMTLTAPGCGMGPVIFKDIEDQLLEHPDIKHVDIIPVFDPPWCSDMMSESAKLELGIL